MTSDHPPVPACCPGRARPRTVLLWVLLAVVVCIGLYALSPWILPVRIYEGPLVQMATQDAATLIWYTTRPAQCSVSLAVGQQLRRQPAVADGRRNRVRLEGLSPGTSYPYEIWAGRRRLSSNLAFQTAGSADEPYTFIVFGDSGRGTRVQYLLAGEMTLVEPRADFVLHTGDLIYGSGGRRNYLERFFAPYRHLIARVSFWPCLGNHELDEAGRAEPYQEVFELPANGPQGLPQDFNYWFDYASSRFAVIDSNADEVTLRDRVAPWLLEVMSAPSPRWKFACLHHPPYSGGKYPPDQRVQRALVPALEQAGVDIVFSGHDHSYQRTHPLRSGQIVEPGQGVVYVITAAAGAELYQPAGPLPDYLATYDCQRYSFTQVTIDGARLTLRQIALGGQIIDELVLQKPTAGDARPAPATSAARTGPS